jgi:hypothetical protein
MRKALHAALNLLATTIWWSKVISETDLAIPQY